LHKRRGNDKLTNWLINKGRVMVTHTSSPPRHGTRGEPEKTRASILKAAVHEFASEGVAGARTDEIARAAGVNKALLYYYFKDKEALYGAVVDSIFQGMRDRLVTVLDSDLPPREKVMKYVGTHFDYVASSPHFPRVVQQEMMRAGRKKSPHLKRIAKEYFVPIFARLSELFRQGMESGDFRPVDVRHFVVCMIGSILHYFNTVPFAAAFGERDPLAPEQVAAQRAAVLDFVSHALLKEPKQ
jgi:TetR/AcrR family transcriptional regulator